MDLLGTKKAVEIFEKSLGVVLPKANADLEKLGEALDAGGIFLAEATDLVKGLDGIVHKFPEQWQAIVREAVLTFARARETEAAVLRLIFKASRKLDGIPDHLFPLTIQTPKGD